MASATPTAFEREMAHLRVEMSQVNMSTVCDKRELNLDVIGPKLNYGQVAQILVTDVLQSMGRRLALPFRRLQVEPA